jgi:hypothetical protein
VRIQIELTGKTALLCHSIALADPDNKFARDISVITGKRKKTEEDRRAIERFEWFGGLYIVDGIPGPAMPTGNIRKCIIQAAKVTKQGLMVQRALHFADLHVPIAHPGPKNLEALWKDESYRNRSAVGIQGKRTMRVRPCFPNWAVVATAELVEDVMDLSDFERVVEKAGVIEGLGDNRVNGYGRFEGKVIGA